MARSWTGSLKVRAVRLARQLTRYRHLVIAALFCIGVGFELHGYSIGLWDNIVCEKTPEYSYPSVGKNRSIRSDEWIVSTPWCIAQTQTTPRFPSLNTNLYTSGMYMGLSTPNSPVSGATAVGQFHNWGFFLFNPARGLAWNWWSRYLGLFLLSFEFLLLVTGANGLLAFAGALSLTLASPTQWWDTTMPYYLLYLFGFLVSSPYFLHAGNRIKQACAAMACVVCGCSFAILLYPPFQIPLFFICAGVSICFCLTYPRQFSSTSRWILMTAGALFAGYVLWRFVAQNRIGIERMIGTAYPGLRSFHGGNWRYMEHLLWPLVTMYFPFRDATFLNNCEPSMFLVPFPALIISPHLFRQAKPGLEKRVFCALILVGTGLAAWCLFPFPTMVGRILLLHVVDPHRAFVAASLALLLAGICGAHLVARDGLSLSRTLSTAISVAATLIVIAYTTLHPRVRAYFFPGATSLTGIAMIAYSAFVFGGLSYGLLRGRIRVFACALILYALPTGWMVHPLSSGISPFMDKKLAVVARQLQRTNPTAKWISVNDWGMVSQYLTAMGVPMVTGTHSIPDVGLWRRLDQEGSYEAVYNRYGNVTVSLSDDGPLFENPITDHVQCALRAEDLRRIPRLTFVISRGELPTTDFELVAHLEIDGFYIYRIKPSHP